MDKHYYCELCFDTVSEDDYYDWCNMYLCSNCEQEFYDFEESLHTSCDEDEDENESEYTD